MTKRGEALRRAHIVKLTTCQRCNGKGEYVGAISKVIVKCLACDGTGRVIPY